jgi:hypothetical protein
VLELLDQALDVCAAIAVTENTQDVFDRCERIAEVFSRFPVLGHRTWGPLRPKPTQRGAPGVATRCPNLAWRPVALGCGRDHPESGAG